MTIDSRLAALGIELPAPRAPAFAYVPVAVDGGLAWVSGQLPWRPDGSLPRGRVGEAVTAEEGWAAARLCVLNGLGVLRASIGSLDRVRRIVKVTGFVASAPGFVAQPAFGATKPVATEIVEALRRQSRVGAQPAVARCSCRAAGRTPPARAG